ncbi:MAG: hypothetical protein JSW34_04490 [Candidatus Zixiibacteriota bacterium]|nr:MAG: hypothetical protein JSW34_04490 [candidate division Zixibacteria bacterium]
MTLPKKVMWILTALTVVGVGSLTVVNYSDACLLKEVTYNRGPVDDWQNAFGLSAERSVVRQPVDSMAQALLERKSVFKVDVDYSLAGGIDITINDFEPACFLLDSASGDLYGVSHEGRVIGLRYLEFSWEHPVLTSLKAGRLHSRCEDARVTVVVEQLKLLRRENIDLHRLVDEIDFAKEDHLRLTIAGLPYRLKVRAERLFDDLGRFMEFVSRFSPDMDNVRTVDLRFDEMVICARGKT